jgi:regulator of RNase E activity RraA
MAIDNIPELLPADVIERAKKLSSALLADGLKGLGAQADGCMDAAILPVDASMKAAGTAFTVETQGGDNFPVHLATYTGGPGYVMVIDGKGYDKKAYVGGLIAGAAKAVGYEGIVCDGYVRDRDGLVEMGFPVYARGLMQGGPDKKNPGGVNGPVVCGGITVNPGDLVVGDADGVTVVPREKIAEALDNAEKKLAYEVERVAAIAAYAEAKLYGGKPVEIAPQWVLDMLGKS